jgi:hypothetical protein
MKGKRDMESKGNRKQRRASAEPEKLDTKNFVELADRFVDVANRANRTVLATDVHMAFLYGAARYNAHVGKNVRSVADHEAFVEEMAGVYKEMLRNHLADPAL